MTSAPRSEIAMENRHDQRLRTVLSFVASMISRLSTSRRSEQVGTSGCSNRWSVQGDWISGGQLYRYYQPLLDRVEANRFVSDRVASRPHAVLQYWPMNAVRLSSQPFSSDAPLVFSSQTLELAGS